MTKPKLRIEANHVDLYTNDANIFSLLHEVADLVHEVDLVNPNIKSDEIECDKLPLDKYQYRVILKDKCRNARYNLISNNRFNDEGSIKLHIED